MSAWHVDDAVVAAYGERRLDPVQRASVEAHAARCGECRDALGAVGVTEVAGAGAPGFDLDRLWSRVEARVTTPEVSRVDRVLIRLGLSMPDLVVLRFAAAGSRQWTIATTLVLTVTALAAVLGPVESAHASFLIVAPLLPALGVAATYRLVPPGVDLLERTAPYPPARLLLWRTAYVVTAAVPVAVALGLVVLRHPGAAVSWLLPALACTLSVVAAATRQDPTRPAAVVAVCWTAVVVAWQVRDTPWAITDVSTQGVALALSVAAALVLHRRLAGGPNTSAVGGI